jgi:hypothetical protein
VIPQESESSSGAYPRIYRASGGWLVALIVCGMLLFAAGMVLSNMAGQELRQARMAYNHLPCFRNPWPLLPFVERPVQNYPVYGSH